MPSTTMTYATRTTGSFNFGGGNGSQGGNLNLIWSNLGGNANIRIILNSLLCEFHRCDYESFSKS